MKAFTTMNDTERNLFNAAWNAMTKENQDIMLHFGADCYINGQIHGIAMGAGGVLAGCILGVVSGKVIDIIHQRRATKKLIKELEK